MFASEEIQRPALTLVREVDAKSIAQGHEVPRSILFPFRLQC